MGLETTLKCSKCNEKLSQEKEHNPLNLAWALSVTTGISVATDQYYLMGLAPLIYILDIPLGPEIKYHCKKCNL